AERGGAALSGHVRQSDEDVSEVGDQLLGVSARSVAGSGSDPAVGGAHPATCGGGAFGQKHGSRAGLRAGRWARRTTPTPAPAHHLADAGKGRWARRKNRKPRSIELLRNRPGETQENITTYVTVAKRCPFGNRLAGKLRFPSGCHGRATEFRQRGCQ